MTNRQLIKTIDLQPVADITALKAITNPKNGDRIEVQGEGLYSFNVAATDGEVADDGTVGKWNKFTSGLRGEPVADDTELKALKAKEFELRLRKDVNAEYIFIPTADLVAGEDTNPENLADDAGTGKWVRQQRLGGASMGIMADYDLSGVQTKILSINATADDLKIKLNTREGHYIINNIGSKSFSIIRPDNSNVLLVVPAKQTAHAGKSSLGNYEAFLFGGGSGLRGTPVADNAALTALNAKDYERRKVTDTAKEYVFHLGGTYDAARGDLKDDADTGIWIPTVNDSSQLVDFDYQLGNIVHAIPDSGKAIYEINGQVITDVKLAAYLNANPINGFSVNGNDVTTPDWRGRYLGATGARGLSTSAGAIYSSTNRSHAHNIRTDYSDSGASSQSGSIIGEANSNTNNTHRGTSKTRYDGSTYARPETAAMPICIVGGRSIKVLIDNVTVDATVGQDDLVKFDLANSKFVQAVVPGLTPDQILSMDQSQEDDFSTYAFTGNPRHLTFQFQLYKDGGSSDYSYSNISVPFSLIKLNGNAYYTIASFNGVDPSYEEGVETAKIMIYVKYIDDTHIDLRVVKTGYEKNDGWNKRNYNLVKIVAEY